MKAPRLRISLLNAVLILTIFAMGVGLWHTGNEVVPLRAQAKIYRQQLGHFKVEDPRQIYAKRATGVYSQAFRWLLYLPSAANYKLYIYEGNVPDEPADGKAAWLKAIRDQARGFEGELMTGQYAMDVSLEEYDGSWFCRYGFLNEIKKTFQFKPADGWLKDLAKFEQYGDVGIHKPKSFATGEPVVLLHIRRGIITEWKGDWRVEEPVGSTDSLVIWIEGT